MLTYSFYGALLLNVGRLSGPYGVLFNSSNGIGIRVRFLMCGHLADAIHVGASSRKAPQELMDQLANPGTMFIPVGDHSQVILVVSARVILIIESKSYKFPHAGRQRRKRKGEDAGNDERYGMFPSRISGIFAGDSNCCPVQVRAFDQ